jgi:hypothetical protein
MVWLCKDSQKFIRSHKFQNIYLQPIKAGVPQGSVLGSVLYLLYTNDLPQPEGTTVATFADDTALVAVGGDIAEATKKLQRAADEINNWSR